MPRSNPFYRKHQFRFFVIGTVMLVFVFAFAKKEDSHFNSFRKHFQENARQEGNDTVPGKNKKGGTLDDQFILDRQLNMQHAVQAMKAAEQRMKEVQFELKMQDCEKVQQAYSDAMNNLNFKLIQKNIAQALADVQMNDKLLQEKVMLANNVQMKALKMRLDQTTERLTRQREQTQMDVEYLLKNNLERVNRSLERAQMELKQLRSFTDDLEKDGLIEKGGKYTIEIKKSDLYINGVKQPDRVIKKYREKYKPYFEGKDGFMLRSNHPALESGGGLI